MGPYVLASPIAIYNLEIQRRRRHADDDDATPKIKPSKLTPPLDSPPVGKQSEHGFALISLSVSRMRPLFRHNPGPIRGGATVANSRIGESVSNRMGKMTHDINPKLKSNPKPKIDDRAASYGQNYPKTDPTRPKSPNKI